MKHLTMKRLMAFITVLCLALSLCTPVGTAFADEADVDLEEIIEQESRPAQEKKEQPAEKHEEPAEEKKEEKKEVKQEEQPAPKQEEPSEPARESEELPEAQAEEQTEEQAEGPTEEQTEEQAEEPSDELPGDAADVQIEEAACEPVEEEPGLLEMLLQATEEDVVIDIAFTRFETNFDGMDALECRVGDEADDLVVYAEAGDAALSYQWYAADPAEPDALTAIEGATTGSFAVNTAEAADVLLCAEVTATLDELSETKRTHVVRLTVSEPLLQALLDNYEAEVPNESLGSVQVIVENTVWPEEDGAPWDGQLVNTTVELNADSSVMSCVVAALDKYGYSQTGAEYGYISEIEGLGEFAGGGMSGWMGTLNDWFTNYGFDQFTVANGNLEAGDVIRIMYTCDFGEDIGGSWGNNDTTLKALESSAGVLAPKFSADVKEYTLRIDETVSSVIITPTAANKNFQTKVTSGGTVYKRTSAVPVSNGSEITISCGEGESMNDGAEPTFYTVRVKLNTAPVCVKSEAEETLKSKPGATVAVSLADCFEDADGDALSYKVSVNGAAAVDAEVNGEGEYAFTLGNEAAYTLVFTADDGLAGTASGYSVGIDPFVEAKVTICVGGRTVANTKVELPTTSTLDAALYAVHEACYEGGAAEGYASADSGYGTSITKLWGDSSGAFGYRHNDLEAWNLDEIVADGDRIDAYVYQDQMGWSDAYAYFDKTEVNVGTGEEVVLTLMKSAYDASYTLVDEPLPYATITVDGVATPNLTNKDGRVTLVFNEAGKYAVSAESKDTIITAPLCEVTVTGETVGEGGVSGSGDPRAYLTSLLVHTGTAPSKTTALVRNASDTSYESETCAVFDPEVFSYDLAPVYDSETQLRFRAGGEKTTVYWDGGSKDITWKSGSSKYAGCIAPGHNVVTVTASADGKDDTGYALNIDVIPTLKSLKATDNGVECYLDKAFASKTNEYSVTIPETLAALTLETEATKEGYTVLFDGEASNVIDISSEEKTSIAITVSTEDGVGNSYTLNIVRAPLSSVSFAVTPADARVTVTDEKNSIVEPEDDGSYTLMLDSYTYSYKVALYGYQTVSAAIPAEGGVITVELAVNGNNDFMDLDSEWASFRGNEDNMGITDVETPTDPETTELLWNAKLGTGWAAAPSVEIIVGDALVTMCGTTLYKLDLKTGEILQTGTMVASPSYGYTPPTYADGLIFCPLAGGVIQAFNAETLESVWVYKDPAGGQAQSPIAYSDGYVYVGFWNGEGKDANFVCVSVSDDDKENTDEEKLSTWSWTRAGGFYWAGALVKGDAVIVTTDDDTSGYQGTGKLMSFNKKTGEIISEIDLVGMGDARSSVSYSNGRVFFSTKNGYLCSAKLDTATGELSDLKSDNKNAQSTSTPLVYGDKVYYAVGSGISTSGSKGSFVVADAETLETLYYVDMLGYPQNSMLLSTAYEDSEGYLYFYSTYNMNPGGISLIKVKADGTGTAEDAELIEVYDAAGFSQYCIASIICSKDGVLYYKNDSGNILAVGTPDYVKATRAIEKLGNVTIDSEEDVQKARALYDALSDEDKAKVTNIDALTTAEAKIARIKEDSLTIEAGSKSSMTIGVGETAIISTVDGLEVKSMSSSSTKVATVDERGVVTGVRVGTATVTVTMTNGKKSTVTVKVVLCPTSIDAEDELVLRKGETVVLSAAVLPKGSGSFTAKVKAGSAVTIDGDTITAVEKGTATITLTAERDIAVTKDITVTVQKGPENIALNETELILGVGESFTLVETDDSEYEAPAITWASANKKIATVSKAGVVKGVKKGSTTITVSTKNDAGETLSAVCKVTVKAAPTSIKLDATKLALPLDAPTYALTATMKPANASSKLSWASSDESVATVDENGVVTLLAPGTTTITVKTYKAKVKASCELTLQPIPTTILIGNAPGKYLIAGDSLDLKAKPYPLNAYGKIDVASSDASVIAVSGTTLTAKKAGTAVITLSTSYDKDDHEKSYEIEVLKAPGKITNVPKSITIGVNEDYQLMPEEDGDERAWDVLSDGNRAMFSMSTSSKKVATVDASGLITGVKAGTATITVKTFNGKKATCKVTVKAAPKTIALGAAPSLGVGMTGTIKVTLSKNSASTIDWASSDESVATVDENGLITALKAGTTTITATTFNGLSAGKELTVAPAPETFSLDKETASIKKGKSLTLKAVYNEGAVGSCTLVSSDPKIVVVSGMKLTGKKAGTATITATTANGLTATCTVTVK